MPSRRELANAIRALSMDAVQKANSGHPGMPMGMADIAEVLWNDFLRHNPGNPAWVDRDRFVLSNGHGSMLPYALLHLSGYALPIEEIKNFRQLFAKTPGPPGVRLGARRRDHHRSAGSGSGQRRRHGLAERVLAARFNRPDHTIVDHSHLRVRRRWLPDGRDLARGLLAGWHAWLGQAHCRVRRQRHLHRRSGAGLVHGRYARALPCLRVARGRRRRWSRPRRRRPGDHRGPLGR